jgi:hypothetical protein
MPDKYEKATKVVSGGFSVMADESAVNGFREQIERIGSG